MNKIIPILILATSLAYASISHATPLDSAKQNYQSLCSSCHGKLGHGDGIAAKGLKETPSNIYQELNSWFETEAELIDVVLNGNEEMPAWGSVLDQQQVKEIFAYIEHINQDK